MGVVVVVVAVVAVVVVVLGGWNYTYYISIYSCVYNWFTYYLACIAFTIDLPIYC